VGALQHCTLNITILIFITALLLLIDTKLSCALQLETLIQDDRSIFQLNSQMKGIVCSLLCTGLIDLLKKETQKDFFYYKYEIFRTSDLIANVSCTPGGISCTSDVIAVLVSDLWKWGVLRCGEMQV
jgi:hypothetical protein